MFLVEKELFPWCPFIFEKPFYTRHKIILDFDDAWHLRYTEIPNSYLRQILANKIFQGMQNSKLVIVGNPWLADVAKRAGSQRIKIIPTNFEKK